MITNATTQELNEALEKINHRFDHNIIFRELKQISKNRRQFTIRVIDSKKAGHGRGNDHPNWTDRKGNPVKPRRLVSACWHVHGWLFEELINLNPLIFIKSRGQRIDKLGGNWEDYNVGSMIYPQAASDRCDC
jgi:hypothetical protein